MELFSPKESEPLLQEDANIAYNFENDKSKTGFGVATSFGGSTIMLDNLFGFYNKLSLELMEDPVATVDGHVYDRAAIEKLIAMHLRMASKKQWTNHHEKWALAGEKTKDTDRWPENHPDEDARSL